MAEQSAPSTTQVTVDINTGDPVNVEDVDVEVEVETSAAAAGHWRVGRYLKNVIHAQRTHVGSMRDLPVGIMLTPALARAVVDQWNAINSPYPWGPDVAVSEPTTSTDPVVGDLGVMPDPAAEAQYSHPLTDPFSNPLTDPAADPSTAPVMPDRG